MRQSDEIKPAPDRPFSSLGNRDFRYLLLGNLTTSLGHWAQSLGKGWLVFQLTESPLHLGLMSFALGVPMLFSSPVSGALSDRFDRKTIIWTSTLGMAALAFGLALLVMVDLVQIWHVYCFAVASGVIVGINTPPRQAIIFDLVGRTNLHSAVSLNSAAQHGTRVLGPSLAAVLLGTVGLEGAFFLTAGAWGIGAVTLLKVRGGTSTTPREDTAFFQSMIDGMRYAKSDRTITALILMALAAAVVGWPYMQLMPAYAGDILGLGGSGFGYLMTAGGVGAIFGGMAVMAMGKSQRKGALLTASIVATALGLIGLGAYPSLSFVIILITALGATTAGQMALNNALVQAMVDDRYRGRATAVYFQVWGLMPIGGLAAGAFAEAAGLRATMILLGVLLAFLALWIWATFPGLKKV